MMGQVSFYFALFPYVGSEIVRGTNKQSNRTSQHISVLMKIETK